jgi:serine/threonine protein kinase
MAATLTTDQFVDALRKSNLLDEKRLEAFLQASSPNVPTTPREMAQQLVRQGLVTHFQASQLLVGKWKGFMLAGGKYKLLEKLGAGGMGQVVLCEHVRMKRLVALKVLPTDKLRDDQSALERFDREARASAALDHPNIVRAHDIDTDPNTKLHFLVMEYVDGSSLQDVIKKHGPLDLDRACHYIAEAAEGLQHAHEAGWVHRDIKPGNLLLERTGTVKILDMGLARLFADDSDNLTQKFEKNAVLGTADYLAPEQATNSSDVDIRADIYSLGATFYFLLAGKPPFEDGTVTQKLIWHQTRPPKSIREERVDVPKEIEAIINKMMAKKPMHRYQEPAAIVQALRPWTQQRIEPPADEEMPRLCAALSNYSTAGVSTPLSGLSGPASSIRSRNRNNPRSTSTSRKSLPRILSGDRPPWMKWAAIGGGGLAVLVLGIGIASWLMRGDKPQPVANNNVVVPISKPTVQPPTTTQSPDRPKEKPAPPLPTFVASGEIPPPAEGRMYVASGAQVVGSRPDVFSTLKAALEKATAGSSIYVMIPEVEDQVAVSSRQAGIHIRSGLPNNQRVTWRAPANAAESTPLLKLDSAGAALVAGFTFDGARRVSTLIQLTGASNGVRIEDCMLAEALKQSLVMSDVSSGPGDQAVTFDKVRFTSSFDINAQKGADSIRPAAILCTGPSTAAPVRLNVQWCRFEGMYLSAIQIECPIEADVKFTRFYELASNERPTDAGLVDAINVKAPTGAPINLTLASNTLSHFSNFLRLDRLPDAGSHIVVRNNLYMGSTPNAWVFVTKQPNNAAVKPVFAGSGGNVNRTDTVKKGLNDAVIPRTGMLFKFNDLNMSSDGFLRYKNGGDTAVLMTAGMNGEPVGVPPVE